MKTTNQCGDCMYFSRLHQCCATRIESQDGVVALIRVTKTSPACIDINNPDLRDFTTTLRNSEVLPMIDDDRDWQGLPVVQISIKPEGLRIVGTVDGLSDLVAAIARAIGKGNSSVELLSPESDVYPVRVERRDLASEWEGLLSEPDQESIDIDDLDYWGCF